MEKLTNYEFAVAGIALVTLLLAEYIGVWIGVRLRPIKDQEQTHLSRKTGTGLTILALLLGFSFSAAIHRYDQRKTYEEEEATAISSEYSLAGILLEPDATQVRKLLKQFVNLRIQYFESNNPHELSSIHEQRNQIEAQMWTIVVRDVRANQSPIMGQVLSGINAVLSRPSYSQAAALDRIPFAVWFVLFTLALLCCGLVGYAGQETTSITFHLILPIFLAVSFYIVATLDSQRYGIVRVLPVNLIRVKHEIN